MIHILRTLKKPKESFILFGPRASGKSTWIKRNFPSETTFYFDLLEIKTFLDLQRHPENFEAQVLSLPKKIKWVVIDEFQKIPILLNSVHRLIESTKLKFALTGSSARKLKRGAANLLAGRARSLKMYPFTSLEQGDLFDLNQTLNWGALPKICSYKSEHDKIDYLQSYTHLYLKEEIQQEQLTRKIEPFNYFLEVAAQADGKITNFSKIAKDVGVDTKTIISYFSILEETLMGFFLPAYHRSVRKRQKQSPKFYFFDLGVRRALEGSLKDKLVPRTSEFGRAFESFIINEIIRLDSYHKTYYRFSFLDVSPNGEIDLIIEVGTSKTFLVEIKSTDSVSEDDASTIGRYINDFKNPYAIILSQDKIEKKFGLVQAQHWQSGLDKIFS
ncbi:MAG: hypothetical protein A2504_00285 [Bdellovibrionales bacterium RIFOXYD12_FULL_39_22]|nr:MAG: hypothetical protein A2404_08055 [Bdellovibrionales bacterium RIFOXYC1_FULL_39_130]OFZ76697.1 MAG: hypothetical protein A2560_17570 [Bdellovibrionales bacterium RIFOXYD1_FULL_39_84]OFZ95932.1 MAG: hypothetical protein A2504_00285 [Bdellovibrionales bacterium RIFOXYD12_FULL_39_22]HLE10887.1 AAA family ATPase [Bacteriovoracaceae bacterium]